LLFARIIAAIAARGQEGASAQRGSRSAVSRKPWRLTAAETALRGASLDDTDVLKAAIATSFTDVRRWGSTRRSATSRYPLWTTRFFGYWRRAA
jgi:CO/xanthine dehydrogenase FAD-binding subunit